MNRRQLLAYAGTGSIGTLAGCADPVFQVINSCSHSMPDEQNSTASDGFSTISVVDEMPKQIRDRYSVAVWVDQQYSAESIAQLRIEVLNNQDSTQEDGWGPSPPFSGYQGEHLERETVLWVAPSRSPGKNNAGIIHVESAQADYGPTEDLSAPIDGCWQIQGIGADAIENKLSLRPCEKFARTYSVYADSDNQGCIPSGQYRFETGRWGFDLLIE